ncbi:hypothetical protein T484DRAFT_3258770 [Baffinella frigidus]|nr:hypothetical protein T484DRAFT_3258770 [Cryptophyta sp. CCMP2293]
MESSVLHQRGGQRGREMSRWEGTLGPLEPFRNKKVWVLRNKTVWQISNKTVWLSCRACPRRGSGGCRGWQAASVTLRGGGRWGGGCRDGRRRAPYPLHPEPSTLNPQPHTLNPQP